MPIGDNFILRLGDLYNFKGKTIKEIADGQYWFSQGISVYILKNDEDESGDLLATELSMTTILKQYPHIADCKVLMENDFYGMKVVRISLPQPKDKIDKNKILEGLKFHLHPEETIEDGETWTEHCFRCPYYPKHDCTRALLSDCEKLLLEETK